MKKLIAIIFFPLAVSAEPGQITQYLSNEPATLFDIGMMRLEALTSEFRDRVGLTWTDEGKTRFFRGELNSAYDPGQDKIIVSFLTMNSEPTEEQMAEGCSNAMDQMNIWLLKNMHSLFEHSAIVETAKPPDFYAGLQELFEIRCYFSSSGSTGDGRFWAWRKLGRLGSDEMIIGKWDMND